MASEDRSAPGAVKSGLPAPKAEEAVDCDSAAAPPASGNDQDIEWLLTEAPHEFSFLSAARSLECRFSDHPKIGTARRPSEEPVRFSQAPYLEFAPATLAAYERKTQKRPAKLTSFFFGLFGPDGALPLHLTEYALNRIKYHRDPTFARFVDVFHHRMTTFFYRAWAEARPTVSFDRPADDRFAIYVGSLIGLGMPSMRGRDAMPDLAKFFYAGHFANQSRHADGLISMLEDYFNVQVRVQEFVPEWINLPLKDRLYLGEPGGGVLGENATIGASVFHCQHKFKLIFGPLSFDTYKSMTPAGDNLTCLVAFVRNYVGDEFDFDLNLILRKDEVPKLALGREGELGWTTWLGTREADTDADDMVTNPVSALARTYQASAAARQAADEQAREQLS